MASKQAVDAFLAILVVTEILGIIGFVQIMIWFATTNLSRLTASHLFLVSLSFNDFLHILLLTNFIIATFSNFNPTLMKMLCEIEPTASIILFATALWHFAFFSIYRSLVLHTKTRFSEKSRLCFIICVLTFSRLIPLTMLTSSERKTLKSIDPRFVRCHIKHRLGLASDFGAVLNVSVPCALIAVGYACCLFAIQNKKTTIKASRRGEWLRRQNHILKVFGLILVKDVVGNFPYFLNLLCSNVPVKSLPANLALRGVMEVSKCLTPYIACLMDVGVRSSFCNYLLITFFSRLCCGKNCVQSGKKHKGPVTLTRDTEVIRTSQEYSDEFFHSDGSSTFAITDAECLSEATSARGTSTH